MSEPIIKRFVILTFLLLIPTFSFAQVYINEIQVLPTGGKFLELHNVGDSIPLTDWYIKKKTKSGSESSLVVSSRFKDKSIPAGGYFLIANEAMYTGGIPIDVGWPQSSTGIASDNTVILYDNNNNEIDKVGWGEASDCLSPCPPNPPSGQSIQRITSGWIIAASTPGAINSSDPSSGSYDATSTSATTTAQTDTTSNNNTSLSSHTSFVEVSTYKPADILTATIGRNRLSSVGIPTEFEAKSNVPSSSVFYYWSFGDGSSAEGRRVEHIYDFPGDYVVVMNAKYFDEVSVSRVNIKVIEPNLYIEEANDKYIKIKNNSAFEANLYGWKLYYNMKAFVFPVDTIIMANASTEFSSRVTGFHPSNSSEVRLGTSDKPVINKLVVTQNTRAVDSRVTELYEKAVAIREQLASIKDDSASKPLPVLSNLAAPIVAMSSTTAPINNWFETLKRFLFKKN